MFAVAPVFAVEAVNGQPNVSTSDFDPRMVNVSFLAYPPGVRARAKEELTKLADNPEWLKAHYAGQKVYISEASLMRLPLAEVAVTARGGSASGTVLGAGAIQISGQNSALNDTVTIGLETKDGNAAKVLAQAIREKKVFFEIKLAFNSLAEQSTWLRIMVSDVRNEDFQDRIDPTGIDVAGLAKKAGKPAEQCYSLDQVTRAISSATRRIYVTRMKSALDLNELTALVTRDMVQRFIDASMERLNWEEQQDNKEFDKYLVFVGKRAFYPNEYKSFFSKESESITTLVSTFSEKLFEFSSESELTTYLEKNFEQDVEREERDKLGVGGAGEGHTLFGGGSGSAKSLLGK